MSEMPVVTNLACTHAIIPLADGLSRCVLIDRNGGHLQILGVAHESIPDAEAQRWLQEQG